MRLPVPAAMPMRPAWGVAILVAASCLRTGCVATADAHPAGHKPAPKVGQWQEQHRIASQNASSTSAASAVPVASTHEGPEAHTAEGASSSIHAGPKEGSTRVTTLRAWRSTTPAVATTTLAEEVADKPVNATVAISDSPPDAVLQGEKKEDDEIEDGDDDEDEDEVVSGSFADEFVIRHANGTMVIMMPISCHGCKDKVLVAVLNLLGLSLCGVVRCYLGNIPCGVLQGVTLGGCGVWALMDTILIWVNSLERKMYIDTLGLVAQFEVEGLETARTVAMIGIVVCATSCGFGFCAGVTGMCANCYAMSLSRKAAKSQEGEQREDEEETPGLPEAQPMISTRSTSTRAGIRGQ